MTRKLIGGNVLFTTDEVHAAKARLSVEQALFMLMEHFRRQGIDVCDPMIDAHSCEDPCG